METACQHSAVLNQRSGNDRERIEKTLAVSARLQPWAEGVAAVHDALHLQTAEGGERISMAVRDRRDKAPWRRRSAKPGEAAAARIVPSERGADSSRSGHCRCRGSASSPDEAPGSGAGPDSPPETGAGLASRIARRIAVGAVRAYQLFISPLFGPMCRFQPTCSEYMRRAVLTHGVVRGVFLGVKRIFRCHPWNEGGYDPVPTAPASKRNR